jgi:serine/threonine protein phosphatase PrpC
VSRLQVATLSRPLAGEIECGDRVAGVTWDGPAAGPDGQPAEPVSWLIVIDGLGHGPLAALAARKALDTIETETRARPAMDVDTLLKRLDTALIGTRGAAVGLARMVGDQMSYAGIGNTRALRWRAGQLLRLPSHYGVVGDGIWGGPVARGVYRSAEAQPLAQDIDLLPGDWVLLFSDGLDESLQLETLLPEWKQEPQRLCSHLMARWAVARDDAAVLVCQVLAPADAAPEATP